MQLNKRALIYSTMIFGSALFSGCATITTVDKMMSNHNSSKIILSDTLIAYGYSKQPIPEHENAVIIVGKQHNYLVEAANEEPQKDIFKKVVTQLDLKYLTISSQSQNSREFNIYHRNQNEPLHEQLKIQFNKPGSLITNEQQTLKQLGFECHATTTSQGSYCYRMVHYTISPIPKTNNDADLKHLFKQPIKFSVSAPSNGSSLAKAPYALLLPITIVLDIVTLPIQLVGFSNAMSGGHH